MRIPKITIKCMPPQSETGRNLGWYLRSNTVQQKLKNNRNPFGSRGNQHHGFKVKDMRKRIRRTDEEEKIVRDAREIKEIAARHAPEALAIIVEIMKNPKSLDAVRLAAANAMIDRGYGKSTQTSVTATVNADGKPSEIDDKSLDERIVSALTRIERITDGAAKPPPSEKRPTNIRELN